MGIVQACQPFEVGQDTWRRCHVSYHDIEVGKPVKMMEKPRENTNMAECTMYRDLRRALKHTEHHFVWGFKDPWSMIAHGVSFHCASSPHWRYFQSSILSLFLTFGHKTTYSQYVYQILPSISWCFHLQPVFIIFISILLFHTFYFVTNCQTIYTVLSFA